MCLSIHCNHGFTRRGVLKAAAGLAALAGFAPVTPGGATAKEAATEKPKPNAIGGDEALRRLIEGNARYVANKPTHRDFSAGRARNFRSPLF